MITLITIVHVLVSVLLILIVLLQIGKGANLSNLFSGGGSEALLTSAGGDVFLKKVTVVLAVIFFLTSFSLTIFSARKPRTTVLDKVNSQTNQGPIGEPGLPMENSVQEQAPSLPVESEQKPGVPQAK